MLAENYKYDVEILESGDNEDGDRESSEELEERFKGNGILNTDTDSFAAENIEMTPVDVESGAISESHMLLSIILVVVALVSVCLYAGLVIWRSHLEWVAKLLIIIIDFYLKSANFWLYLFLNRQRYGMRERLVTRDVDEEGIDDTDYHVVYPHTLSPYAPTTIATTATTMRS